MDVGLNIFPKLNLSPAAIVGLVVAAFGLLLLVAVFRGANVLVVPDGIAPDKFYRTWKSGTWVKRIGKKRLFVFMFGASVVAVGLLSAFKRDALPVPTIPNMSYENVFGGREYTAWGMATGAGLVVIGLAGHKRAQKRPLTDEEKQEAARRKLEERKDRELFSLIRKEALHLKREIPDHMGVQNRFQHGEGDGRRMKKMRFEAILMNRAEIWFRFDGRPGKLPYGTSFHDITNPERHVLENIQYGIGRPCRFYEDYKFNLFLRVGLKSSLMGIPKRVNWSDIIHKLPKQSRYALPIGVGENNKLIYRDFRQFPHVVVAGSTQQGKSTLLLQWIATLLQRNTPDQLQFIFIDLKEGVELNRFRELPHTLNFIEEPEDVPAALKWVYSEYQRRARMFKGVCQDIKGWNAQRPNKLQYIIVVVDEMGDLMLGDADLRKTSVDLSTKLARKARMAGIHLWYTTQIIEAKVLPLQIRGNFPVRICFAVPGYDESRLVLGNGQANGLEPVGRCVYKYGAGFRQLQAPIATDSEIEAVIEAARGGGGPEAPPFDDMDMFRVVLYNLGGEARYRDIYENVSAFMSEHRIKKTLKQFQFNPELPEASVLEIDGGRYVLSHPGMAYGKRRPRKLVAVNGRFPATADELMEMAWNIEAEAGGEKDSANPLPGTEKING